MNASFFLREIIRSEICRLCSCPHERNAIKFSFLRVLKSFTEVHFLINAAKMSLLLRLLTSDLHCCMVLKPNSIVTLDNLKEKSIYFLKCDIVQFGRYKYYYLEGLDVKF